MSDEEIINEAKKIIHLTPAQGRFLLDWCDSSEKSKDQEFGFWEVRGFTEQLKMAIDFYLKTEREWQEKIKEDRTNLSFKEYFLYKTVEQGINLSPKFVHSLLHEKLHKKIVKSLIKGDTNEIPRTQ